jgi:hypothetical protein
MGGVRRSRRAIESVVVAAVAAGLSLGALLDCNSTPPVAPLPEDASDGQAQSRSDAPPPSDGDTGGPGETTVE